MSGVQVPVSPSKSLSDFPKGFFHVKKVKLTLSVLALKNIFFTRFLKSRLYLINEWMVPFQNAKDALLYNGDIKRFYCLGRDGICSSISLSFLLR